MENLDEKLGLGGSPCETKRTENIPTSITNFRHLLILGVLATTTTMGCEPIIPPRGNINEIQYTDPSLQKFMIFLEDMFMQYSCGSKRFNTVKNGDYGFETKQEKQEFQSMKKRIENSKHPLNQIAKERRRILSEFGIGEKIEYRWVQPHNYIKNGLTCASLHIENMEDLRKNSNNDFSVATPPPDYDSLGITERIRRFLGFDKNRNNRQPGSVGKRGR